MWKIYRLYLIWITWDKSKLLVFTHPKVKSKNVGFRNKDSDWTADNFRQDIYSSLFTSYLHFMNDSIPLFNFRQINAGFFL